MRLASGGPPPSRGFASSNDHRMVRGAYRSRACASVRRAASETDVRRGVPVRPGRLGTASQSVLVSDEAAPERFVLAGPDDTPLRDIAREVKRLGAERRRSTLCERADWSGSCLPRIDAVAGSRFVRRAVRIAARAASGRQLFGGAFLLARQGAEPKGHTGRNANLWVLVAIPLADLRMLHTVRVRSQRARSWWRRVRREESGKPGSRDLKLIDAVGSDGDHALGA